MSSMTWDRERWLDEAYDARNDDVDFDLLCPECAARWFTADSEDEGACPHCGAEALAT